MSEAKRVPLQTLEFPESLGYAAKKEKKEEKGKQLAPSFRFVLTLPESNEKACPEFNYAQLLKAGEKKRRKEHKQEDTINGLPFDDDGDDDDKLRDMARRFEAKYGTSTTSRKRTKYDDYVDLGAGYDENDSFIDNTDAYDEIVPEDVTTAHGGFYINCGALEFRSADRHSLVHNNNNNNNNNNSNEEESSESSEEDTEDVDSPKRSEKRIHSSSDEDEAEDITGDQPRKKQKLDENGEKKSVPENIVKKKKKQPNLQDQQNSQQDGEALTKKKEKAETTDTEVSEDQEEKKKSDKTDPPKSKSTLEKKFDIKKFEKKAANTNGFDGKKIDFKKLSGKDSNIDDAIESVVNAARVEDESSRDTTDSGKSRCIGTESECDENDKETPLPDSLPENVVEIVNKLKARAENNKEGKTKFFDTTVNVLLLSLEKRLRTLSSPATRIETYEHLARFLPCSKMALQNRTKKLYVQDVESSIKDLVQRLKEAIDAIAPSMMCKYFDDCQKSGEEKDGDGLPDSEILIDEDNCENSEKKKLPKEQLPWTEETKKLVYEIANARRQIYTVLRPRKSKETEDMFNFVASYMVQHVLPLWPSGCMTQSALLQFVKESEPVTKKKQKKAKDVGNGTSTGASVTVVYNSVGKVEPSSVNSVLSQSKEKLSATVSKVANAAESSSNYVKPVAATKSNENAEKKQQNAKHKEKSKDVLNSLSQQHESLSTNSANSTAVGKISVVPTAQLMAMKPAKCHVEKINLLDLGNSSLSITPVSEFHKSSAKANENKKDVVSITAYPETSNVLPNANEVPQSGHHSIHRQQEASYSCSQPQHSNYPALNQTTTSSSSSHSKPVSLKHRLLHENAETKNEKKSEEKDVVDVINKTEKRDKRRERGVEVKHKSNDVKKRKKEAKAAEKQIGHASTDVVVPMQQQQPSLSKEEQEQRQNEETIAATNYLSQIINDDAPARGVPDKRKDGSLLLDEPVSNTVQPTEQETDVQMVMRSLKELQQLQEMKYSPSNSPVTTATMQKPNKLNAQCTSYQDDYSRLYIKKDAKIKSKEDTQWQ
ncbi:yemanuclein isoform X2 [Lasioglossum baleicum]|uniref:yemanuclein isoform X2 n=1 Tax=Lasioglossum baleicum TaxID=434251 RepID=UPI003FCD3D70